MEAEDCRYLKGPVSWQWLSKAASLPGKALHLALALCVMSGIRRSKEVTVPTKLLQEMGIERHSAYRALEQLEEAGLVSLDRQRGRKPRVMIHLPEVKFSGRPVRRTTR